MELQWRLPGFGDFLTDLGVVLRLIRFDKRGTGMSDPVSGAPSLETRMDDVRAVMDAVGLAAGRVLRPVGGSGDEHPVRRHLPGSDRGAGRAQLLAPDAVGAGLPVGPQREPPTSARSIRRCEVYASRAEAREAVRALGMQRRRRGRGIHRLRPLRSEPRDARGAVPDEQGDRHPARPAHACASPRWCMHGSEDQIVPIEVGRIHGAAAALGATGRSCPASAIWR